MGRNAGPGNAIMGGNGHPLALRLVQCGIRGHDGDVTAVEFDPTGRWLVSGSMDQRVKLWNTKDYSMEWMRLIAGWNAR